MALAERILENLSHGKRMAAYNAAFAAYSAKEDLKDSLENLDPKVTSSVGALAFVAISYIASLPVFSPPTVKAEEIPEPPNGQATEVIEKEDQPQEIEQLVNIPPSPLFIEANSSPHEIESASPNEEVLAEPVKKEANAPQREAVAIPNFLSLEKPGDTIITKVEEYSTAATGQKPSNPKIFKIVRSILYRKQIATPDAPSWGPPTGVLNHRTLPIGYTTDLTPQEIIEMYEDE